MIQELQQAAAVLLQANRTGRRLDLSNSTDSARREFRQDKDRNWRLNNPIGGINQLAIELARLTGAPFDDCKAAVIAETGDCETTAMVQAIIEFGKQLEQRQVEPSQIKAPARRRRFAV